MNTGTPKKQTKKVNVKYLVRLAFLVALLVVLSFTPLGYLNTGPIAITFLCIPVILAAVLLGPLASTVLGFAFGVSSFILAFSDTIGMALLGINPLAVALALIVPRVLMGLLTGLIFRLFHVIRKTRPISHLIASVSASLLNTVLYTAFLWMLFANFFQTNETTHFANIGVFITTAVGFNGLLELIVCGVFGLIVGRVASVVERRAERKAARAAAEQEAPIVRDAFTPFALPESGALEAEAAPEQPEGEQGNPAH